MKTVAAKHPKQSPLKKSDQTGNKGRGKPPAPPADPRGAKYVHAGQEPISHDVSGGKGENLKFREGVYGKGGN